MPVTGPVTGYSVYVAGENRMAYSEDFSQWSTNASPANDAVTTGAVTAYDGVTLADKIYKPSGVTGSAIRYKAFASGSVNTTYIGAVVLKAAEITRVSVGFGNSAFANNQYGIDINLSTGAFIKYQNNSFPVNYRIEALGDGWYRVIVQATSDADGGNYIFGITMLNADGSTSIVGTNNGYYATQAEVQTGNIDSYTPYVKTTANALLTTKSVQDLGNRYVSKAYATDVYQSLAPSKKSGGLWTWGFNYDGSLGINLDYNNAAQADPGRVGTLIDYEQVATGISARYFIRANGTLWSVGSNSVGELGINSRTHRSSPFQVGALTDWKQISVSSPYDATSGTYVNNALAVKENGTLWAWGHNSYGQLGTNNLTHRSSPTQVGSLTTWRQVFCSISDTGSTFAIKNDGTLWSWGYNFEGQLGLSDFDHRSSPTQVGGDTNWKQVSTTFGTTLAVKSDGTLWSCGQGLYGVLGLEGTNNTFGVFTQIGAETNWVKAEVTINYSAFAIKTDGSLWVWGSNQSSFSNAALSITYSESLPNTYYSSPIQQGSVTNWKNIFNGGNQNGFGGIYALNTRGELYTTPTTYLGYYRNSSTAGIVSTYYGDYPNNWKQASGGAAIRDGYFENVPDSPYNSQPISYSFSGGTNDYINLFENVFASTDNFVDTGLHSWGFNTDGRLGTNDLIHRSSPTQIGSLTTWRDISAGGASTLAIKTDGSLWSWGSATSGALGLGTLVHRSSPTQIGTLASWVMIATGKGSNYAVSNEGALVLYSWGSNSFGQLGLVDTDHRSSPTTLGSAANWKMITAGDGFVFWLLTTGESGGLGYNLEGQLGAETVINSLSGLTLGDYWNYIAASSRHMCGIKTDGTLWSWGNNADGRLGLSDLTHRSSPTQIGALTTWKQVSSGGTAHTLAIKTDGTLWAWGLNTNGRLGLNDLTHRSSPEQVGALTNWKEVQCGDSYTVALKTDGTLWSWGLNTNGQLGINSVTGRSSPFQIGTLTGWKRISAGNNHFIAISSPDLI